MNQEQYIEHEVKLRVHTEQFKIFDEKYEERFKYLESIVKETRAFTRIILGTGITAIILPIILHHYNLI